MDKEEGSDPKKYDFSIGPWTIEEVTEENVSFQSFKRPATPSEYTLESLETKATGTIFYFNISNFISILFRFRI